MALHITAVARQPRWLMVYATFLFALMGVCVKLASAQYGASEIVFYRSLIGAATIALVVRRNGGTLATPLPGKHFWRAATGSTALCLWFYAIGHLPLATAMTLNYSSSVWIAVFIAGSSVVLRSKQPDGRLIAAALIGFVGITLVLRPTIEQNQLWHGLVGLLSGMISALGYLQVTALGRAREPEYRIVFYFSVGGAVAGAAITSVLDWHSHTTFGLAMLLAVGLLATAAQLLLTRAFATGRPLANASLQYLGIAFSFAWGVVLFDDRITLIAIAGIALVIVASILSAAIRSPKPQPATTQTKKEDK